MMATVRTECRDVQEIPECVVLCRPIKKEGDFTASELKNEVNDPELHALLETYIRKFMKGQSDTRVLKIFKCRTKFLVKTDSRYCENIMRNHSSNHVKIVIQPTSRKGYEIAGRGFIHQECFCKCETDLKVLCKDFLGPPYKLPDSICDILYPKQVKKFRHA